VEMLAGGAAAALPLQEDFAAVVAAPLERVFAFLDDHRRLSGHMSKRSWMMAGSTMSIEADALGARAVGSHIRLGGRVLGMRLFVDEVVTEYLPPHRKEWRTIGEPRLLVIGPYRMSFDVSPLASATLVRVSIDYARPHGWLARVASALLGRTYARWCVRQMVRDTIAAFGEPQTGDAA